LGGSFIIPQLIGYYDLSGSNQTASGEIIEAYPQMHSTCKYRFSVDLRVYENIGRSCGDAPIGQTITIYFSPTNPDKSVNGDPRSLFINDLIPFVLALLTFPAIAACAVYMMLR
jgi:hypothetical protein